MSSVDEGKHLPPCPHGDDTSHGGLGQAWCLAGREGQVYVAEREARKAASRKAWEAELRCRLTTDCEGGEQRG